MVADSLKAQLLSHRRIKEVTIASEFSYWKDDYSEFAIEVDKERLAKEGFTISQLYNALNPIFGRKINSGYVNGERSLEQIYLNSQQGKSYDVWG